VATAAPQTLILANTTPPLRASGLWRQGQKLIPLKAHGRKAKSIFSEKTFMSNVRYIKVNSGETALHENCDVCSNWEFYNHLGDIGQSSNVLYALRHGNSLANQQGLIVSDLKHGLTHYGLSEQGVKEAREAMTQLALSKASSSQFVFYSSPFLRTIQTASRAAEVLNVEGIYFDARLRERFFGDWELTSDANYATVWQEDQANPCHKKWGVESTYEVLERMTSAVREINSMHENKHIIFVTHGDAAQILYCGFLGQNPQHHRSVVAMKTGSLRLLSQRHG
jgi:broad specificity phosphatase PhoE